MPFKDKEAQKKAQREWAQQKRKGSTSSIENPVEPVSSVEPNVTPTMADVQAGKAWQVLTGPHRGELRRYGKLAQSWKNAPCNIVDGVCVADHGPDYHHETTVPATPTSLPMVRFIKAHPDNLSKLQRIAGSLGKLAHEVRFGLDGPTFEELGKTIGYQAGDYAKSGKK